jgi:ABC-type lipoprotein release transport system permease subunit
MHAGTILRGAWRTTFVLAVLAGLAGGLVLAGWSAVRRGASTVERFEESVRAADLTVATCGPDGHFDLDAGGCAVPYIPFAERDRIAALPGVEAAGVGAIIPLWYSGPGIPEGTGGGVWAMADGTFPTAMGTPIVVDGRMFDPAAPDEMLVTEDVVAVGGIGVGDTITVRGYPLEQGVDLQSPPQGDPLTVRVVGVVRFPTDLSPRRIDDAVELLETNPFLTPAWFERYGRHLASFATGVLVRAEPGADPTSAITAAFGDQEVLLTPTAAESDLDTVYDAIRYETGVLTAVTVAAALAALAVVGLTIARQAAQEQDAPLVMAAIGATRRQRAGAAALRSIPVALGAVAVAGATAVATSAWTPIGLARRAEVASGVRIDAVPLAAGLPAVAAIVVAAFTAPMLRRQGVTRRTASSIGTVAAAAGCSPQVTTGLVLAFPGGARRASLAPVVAGALAAAAVVSAAMLVGGLEHTLADPVRYGASWDAIIDAPVSIQQELALIDELRDDERLTDAAGLLYTEAKIGDELTLVHAVDPVLGDSIIPVIVDGREPIRAGEIALGGVMMDELGASIGDTVPVQLLTAFEPTVVEAKVVGQSMVNDGFSAEAGDGGLVVASWARELVPGAFAQTFAVRMAPGTTIDDLNADYSSVTPVIPQKGLANLRRIQSLPWLLAAVVAALAVGAMVHTTLGGIRHAAPQLATLRALGFTRRQLRSSVRWGAMFVAVCAAALGIPIGVIAGRWGWRTLGASVGVATEAPLPVVLGMATTAGLIALAAVSALGPASRAARQDPVAILGEERRH